MKKQVAAALLALPMLSAQTPPPVVVPIPPPPAASPNRAEPQLVTWSAGPILCAGQPIAPTLPPRPLPSAGASLAGRSGESVVRLAFSIDARGRPLGITSPSGFHTVDTSDLGPALAASRFAAGASRTDCAVWFTPTRMPFAAADVAEVMGFTVLPTGSRPIRAAWDRVQPAGTTCLAPQPQALNRAFPEFRKIPQAPGTFSWTMVGFDVDAKGEPVNVRRVAGTGNAVLDRESVAAVERSRFEEAARQGCLYPYWRRGDNLTAPDSPETARRM